ncbi:MULTISPECIES: TonB-dependent receptor [unclassified Pseudomonas]|uniref:TonB-dependent siderophore receptor n=1 Tax=unclassified Pseudomonas TaxID=196821 RepID=UPI00128DEFA0|nr:MULTISPECIES: TonB-dependent receptor [unclassified Pseudomonas]MPQ65742.1 TonB-dependent siderophore receptor [Pseudomonas sp. MWU12-2323]
MPKQHRLTPLSKALLVRQLFCSPPSLAVMGMALALPLAAQVQAQEFEFNIGAQPLGSALQELGRQGNIQILYNPERVQGLHGTPVKGVFTPGQAASELLKNTGVDYNLQGDTLTLSDTAAKGSGLTLAATNISGQALGSNTDGTGSYTTGAVTIGKTAQTLRETPQSVTVVTRQQMDDKNLTSLEQVMDQATGITLQTRNFGDNQYNSRGFELGADAYMIDGVPGLSYSPTGWMTPDTAVFDRVEILRGAAGMLVGNGNPGGAVNLVRKRPTADPHYSITTRIGSDDFYRVDLDGTSRLNDSGTLRGRIVTAYETRDYFVDYASSRKPVFYGIVEADLDDATTLAVGLRNQTSRTDGYSVFGLPRYSDGKPLGVSRSTSLAQNWAYHDTQQTELFADLEHRFNDDWKSKTSVTRTEGGFSQQIANSRGSVDPVTLTGPGSYKVLFREDVVENVGLDSNISGNFNAFGLEHSVLIGANWSNQKRHSKTFDTSVSVPINVFDPNPNLIDKPAFTGWSGIADDNARRYGVYANTRLHLSEPLSLVLGGRLSWYEYETKDMLTGIRAANRQDHEFTPFAGLIYDFNPQWSWYASYAEIFEPQSNLRTQSGTLLEPAIGSNYETGIKGELYDGRLNVSAAVFYIKQKNVALANPDENVVCTFNADQYCYTNGDVQRSKGFELEASGEVLTGWQVAAGYTFDITNKSSGGPTDYQTPKHLLRASTTYNLPGDWNRLTVGGGVSAQSGYSTDTLGAPESNGGRAVWDALASYKIDKNWKVGLDVKNIFDKVYYKSIGELGRGNYYGDPRTYMLTVRADF